MWYLDAYFSWLVVVPRGFELGPGWGRPALLAFWTVALILSNSLLTYCCSSSGILLLAILCVLPLRARPDRGENMAYQVQQMYYDSHEVWR